MKIQEIKKNLKLLLAYNVGFVIDLLMEAVDNSNDDLDELVLHLSRYNDLYRDVHTGQATYASVKVDMRQLRLAIMQYINELQAENLNFELVKEQLIHGESFKEVMEHKIKKLHSIGMLESHKLTVEYFEFKWQDYFIHNVDGKLQNQEALIDALELLHAVFEVPLPVKQPKEDIKAFLLESNHVLRRLPALRYHRWTSKLDSSNSNEESSLSILIAQSHEMVSALIQNL